jgi:hypothetical protein
MGMQARIASVNVGKPREIVVDGKVVRTSIWKDPVAGRVAVRGVNLSGDDQSDRKAHGGDRKAVYAYAREDLDWWGERLGQALASGTFGENLTTEGLDVTGAHVGERWRIGDLLLRTRPQAAGRSPQARGTDGPARLHRRVHRRRPAWRLPPDRRGGRGRRGRRGDRRIAARRGADDGRGHAIEDEAERVARWIERVPAGVGTRSGWSNEPSSSIPSTTRGPGRLK